MSDDLTQNPKLACWAERITKNRDFTGGEWPVKLAGELYMPAPADGMSDTGPNCSYRKFLKRVGFFPAAARVHDGCVSLIFNKDPVLESSTLEPIKDRITLKGDSLETFAEHIVSEVLITNYCGILVDHPDDSKKPANLNGDNAVKLGWHPFLAAYPFESILDFDYGYVPALGHQALTWVKLRDNCNQYRELRLTNSVYTVTVFRRETESDSFDDGTTYTPTRNKAPLDFIPFEIIKRHNDWYPAKALLEDVVNINASHYIQEGDMSLALYNCSGPQKVVLNPGKQHDDQGNEKKQNEYPAGSHIVWELFGEHADAKYLEFTGAGVMSIREQQKEYKSQMSATGSRILADEKAVAEAAETLEIRRSSETATLAGVTRTIMRKMEKSLRTQAWWMGAENKDDSETRFTLNLDFTPAKTTPEEIAAYIAAVQAGIMTKEQVFYLIRDGGLLADTVTWEAHSAALDAEVIDPPVVRGLLGTDQNGGI